MVNTIASVDPINACHVGSMQGQRRGRWSSIDPTLDLCLLSARYGDMKRDCYIYDHQAFWAMLSTAPANSYKHWGKLAGGITKCSSGRPAHAIVLENRSTDINHFRRNVSTWQIWNVPGFRRLIMIYQLDF